MNIYTRNFPVSNSGQHIYVTGLFNFLFVLQDLIDRSDSYFQGIAFQRDLLLIGFWHSTSQVFSNKNKQSSLEWRCVNLKGEIMAEIKYQDLHSFKKGVILLFQSIFETRQISHLLGSALFTIPLSNGFKQVALNYAF